ncbi:MAG: phosphatidate cytidylyltransferase [Lachnospiraceae bacterium]|nr:phosphatidate cytidylyltransferase [Lachnospiraceae bacterium]
MLKRTLSGAVLTLVTAAALIEGRYLLIIFLLATSLVGQFELYRVVGSNGLDKKRREPLALCGYLSAVIYYIALFGGAGELTLFLMFPVFMVVMMLIYVFSYPKYEPIDLFSVFFGLIYLPVMLSAVYMLRQSENGLYLVWFVFIGSWVCDTCAYFVGSAMGHHKLAPVLSPKKSIEGAVGGVLGSAIVGALFGWFLQTRTVGAADPGRTAVFVLISALAAVFSQAGDLTASAIKRHYGIKDYGELIPGHGGVLDRFDSMIVTAPLVYLVVVLAGL